MSLLVLKKKTFPDGRKGPITGKYIYGDMQSMQ